MRLAQIENGVVVNVALAEPDAIPDFMKTWIPAGDAGPGWRLEDGQLVPPAEAVRAVPTAISFAQLLIGLVAESWITAEEGRAWRDRVSLPAAVRTLISTLPPEQQFAAETRALAPSEVLREDPLVVMLATAQGKADQLDRFFTTYAEV